MKSATKYQANLIFREVREALLPLYGTESDMLSYILLESYLNIEKKDCLADSVFSLEDQRFYKLHQAIERLKKYEPVQYITGTSHFFGREFLVKPGVLIPRQETEELILLIKTKNVKENPSILDIGSGCGCISVTLALEIEDSKVYALDKYMRSVEMTRKNSRKLDADVKVFKHDIFDKNWSFSDFDIIVSNPPYVTESEKIHMKPNVLKYEPGEALFVEDKNPARFYQRILEITKTALIPGGLLFFEINESYGKKMSKLINSSGFQNVEIVKDLNGKDRFAFGRKTVAGIKK